MKTIAKTPLNKIREKEEMEKQKDAQLRQLGIALTEEKLRNVEKDKMIIQLGKEISQLKLEILEMKGAVV